MAGALPVDITDSELWSCQEDENWLQRNSRHGISHLWDDDNLDNLCYMFEEHTPIKDCVDFAYHSPNNEENMIKTPEGSREPSQCKRRRMLQFNSDVADIGFCNEQLASLVKSKAREEELSLDDRYAENLQCTLEFSDGCAFSNGGLGQSSEGWLAYCFNDSDMNISSEEMNDCGSADAQVDISDYCTIPSEMETDPVPDTATPAPCSNNSKGGKKSYMKTPMKLTTSVAYPFALIKPCGVQGDVTLKDINQRIHAPPPRAKDMKNEDSSHCYPTSAFSGKPVVVKTKIRTEGGKGSITILRTKG